MNRTYVPVQQSVIYIYNLHVPKHWNSQEEESSKWSLMKPFISIEWEVTGESNLDELPYGLRHNDANSIIPHPLPIASCNFYNSQIFDKIEGLVKTSLNFFLTVKKADYICFTLHLIVFLVCFLSLFLWKAVRIARMWSRPGQLRWRELKGKLSFGYFIILIFLLTDFIAGIYTEGTPKSLSKCQIIS